MPRQITLTDIQVTARTLVLNAGTGKWELVYQYTLVDAQGQAYGGGMRAFNIPPGSQAQVSALDAAAIAGIKQMEGL